VEAADGGAALEHARTQDKIGVVILDGKMPGLGSSELLRALKRALPEVPVVMLSGSAGIRDASAVVDGQVFAELQKPCELEELMRTIRSAIRATGRQPAS